MVSATLRNLRDGLLRRYRAGFTAPADSSGAAVERADRLCAAGKLDEAIALLTGQNARQPDIVLEKRIIALRREAFDRLQPGTPPDWNRATQEHAFAIDECGLPFIRASELSPELVRAALAQHGSLLIRGLLDTATATGFVEGLDQALDQLAAVRKGNPAEAETPFYAPDYDPEQPRGRGFIHSTGGILAIDSPRLMTRLIDAFRQLGIDELVTQYLGERPAISIEKCTLRRMKLLPQASWHQDGAFLGDVRSLNLWIALTPCGTHAPGLDIVAKPLDGMVESGTGDAMFPWCVGDEMARQVAGAGGIASPEFAAGDAVIFDHTNLHRTRLIEGMTSQRHAIETWFFAPSKFPEGYTGLLL